MLCELSRLACDVENMFPPKRYPVCTLKRIAACLSRQYASSFKSDTEIERFVVEHTEVAGARSLTPELALRLFTPNCRFWHERPELWPLPEPYWAIYWPGGQALTRYLLDNPEVSRDKRVLDLGCGCGASAIAAQLCGASHVVANDIDPVAVIATRLNAELNGLRSPAGSTDDLIGSRASTWDLVLLGDMFYEEALADRLHSWLRACVRTHGTRVLIGDPGRAQFQSHGIRTQLLKQAEFDLPDPVREENYGLTSSSVWRYEPLQ